MRIIPVIDVKQGQVVHAVGGRRDEYRPIRSRLVHSTDPVHVARVFRDALRLKELYLADLDAIAGAAPALALYRALADMGLNLMIDAGVGDAAKAQAVHDCGVQGVVIGLETLAGPRPLCEIAAQLPHNAVWFSLDLKNGAAIGRTDAWRQPTAEGIAEQAIHAGVRQLIVLDIARVGEASGTHTDGLCRRLHEQHPNVELLAGGGIRDDADLARLADAGVAGALIASALHAGTIRLPHDRTGSNPPS